MSDYSYPYFFTKDGATFCIMPNQIQPSGQMLEEQQMMIYCMRN